MAGGHALRGVRQLPLLSSSSLAQHLLQNKLPSLGIGCEVVFKRILNFGLICVLYGMALGYSGYFAP